MTLPEQTALLLKALELLDVIPPALQAKVESVLRHYLASAGDIARFVPMKCHISG
jgi:hypothetical protein